MAFGKPGRKPKLTRETEARLLSLLRAGVPREVACAGVGIASRTLRVWLTRAANGEDKYVRFADKLESAQAEAQSSLILQIRSHGKKDWRANAFILERVFAKTYAERFAGGDTDSNKGPLEVVIRRAVAGKAESEPAPIEPAIPKPDATS